MKKFTIFLLTFLLFVGFINVNAQTRDASGFVPSTQSSLNCVPDAGDAPTNVSAYFTLTGGSIGAVSNQKIFMSINGDPWVDVSDDIIYPIPAMRHIFGYEASFPFTGSVEFYATITETNSGVPFEWNTQNNTNPSDKGVTITVLDPPTVSVTSDIAGFLCEGSDVLLTASALWPDAAGYSAITYAWTDGEDGVYVLGTPQTLLLEDVAAGPHTYEFSITVLNQNGVPSATCIATGDIEFEILDLPEVTLTYTGDNPICHTASGVTINATPTSFEGPLAYRYTYFWNEGEYTQTGGADLHDGSFNASFTSLNLIEGGDNVFSATLEIFNYSGDLVNPIGSSTGCVSELSNEITIEVRKSPIAAEAGDPQTECTRYGTDYFATFTVTGNAPETNGGTGTWSVFGTETPAGGFTQEAGSLEAEVLLSAGQTVTMRWTISNPPCNDRWDDVVLTAKEKPRVTVDPMYIEVCQGTADVIMTATAWYESGTTVAFPPYTWVWDVEDGVGNDDGSTSDVSIFSVNTDDHISGSIYTVYVTDDNGCEGEDEGQINVYQTPVVTLEEEYTACQLATLEIDAVVVIGSERLTFIWTVDGDIVSETGATLTFDTDVEPGDYAVTVKVIDNVDETIPDEAEGFNCESIVVETTVTIYKVPEADAGADREACAADGVAVFNMKANVPDEDYDETGEWSCPDTDVNIADITDPETTVTVPAGTTAVLTWTVTSQECGDATATVELTAWALPTVTLTGANWTCVDTALTITATASSNDPSNGAGTFTDYTWSGTLNGDPGAIAPNTFIVDVTEVQENGTLQVTVTDGNGCEGESDEIIINVYPNPTPVEFLPVGNECDNGDGEFVFDISATPANETIGETGVWSVVSGDADIDDEFAYNTTVTIPAGETATVRWTITSAHCGSSFANLTLTVYANPTVTLSNGITCVGETLEIKASALPLIPEGDGMYEYVWTADPATLGDPKTDDESIFVVTTSAAITGKLQVTVFDPNGCEATSDVLDVIVNANPTISNAGPDQDECANANGEYTFTMDANPALANAGETGTWSIESGEGVTIAEGEEHNPFAQVTVPAGVTAELVWTISNGNCDPSTSTVELTTWNLPTVTIVGDSVCMGTPLTITAVAAPGTAVPGITDFIYNWAGTTITANPAATAASPNFIVDHTLPQDGMIRVTVEDEHCVSLPATAYVKVYALPDITISPLPEKICNHSTITLNATVDPMTSGQQYSWYIYYSSNGGASWGTPEPISIAGLSGPYKVDVEDGITHVKFELEVNIDGKCAFRVETDEIEITTGIKVDIIGDTEAIVCHGGSVMVNFNLSNIVVGSSAAPVYYRWLENGIALGDIYQEYLLPPGSSQLELQTNPALHENEQGLPYCYQLEIWQGIPDPLEPDQCHTFSDCFYLTVVKDPVVTISGPTNITKNSTSEEFTANVVGGYGDPSYTWSLNGVPTAQTGNVFLLEDQNVLGNIGNYDVSVKVIQSGNGCEAQLVVHHFDVGCATGNVTIAGPEVACVGFPVTLTAVIETDVIDYTIQWKKDGQLIKGETGLTLTFTAAEPIDISEYQLEVTFCACELTVSPIHYFQPIPATMAFVDNYVICENGAVTVEVNYANWDGQIYRYLWYTDIEADEPWDITYVNYRLFDYSEMDGDVTTFYVKVEMLNAVCSSNLESFTITVQGSLEPVVITPATAEVCIGKSVYFTIDNDPNTQMFGTPEYTWWVDGFEIPGNLNYINIPFLTEGVHYIYASLSYPGTTCEVKTASAVVTTTIAPEVYIDGPNMVCNAENPTFIYAFRNNLDNSNVSYEWYVIHDGVETALGTEYMQQVSNVASPYPYLYFVILKDLVTGCEATSATHSVTVEEFAPITISADKIKVCIDDNRVELTADVSGENNMGYMWYENGIALTTETTAKLVVFPTDPTTVYSFKATQIGSACAANSNAVTITVIEIPVITSIAVSATDICMGGAVKLTALPALTGVTYTWERNGIIIEGAVSAEIIDFPLTIGENVTTYTYSVIATVNGDIYCGCTYHCVSEAVTSVPVTVSPELKIDIVGPTVVCENEFTLTGFVLNNNSTNLIYSWFILEEEEDGEPILPTEYLGGFEETFGETIEPLLANEFEDYPFSYLINPGDLENNTTIPGWNTTFWTNGSFGPFIVCGIGDNNASSQNTMYILGKGDAVAAGETDGEVAGGNQADTHFATIEDAIKALAAAQATADAAIAGPAISEAAGELQAILQAQILAGLYANSVIEGSKFTNLNSLPLSSIPAPNPADYIQSCTPGSQTTQVSAYNLGYTFSYKGSYLDAYQAAYIDAIIDLIVEAYVSEYTTVFASDFSDHGYTTSSITGLAGEASIDLNLPARDYPYTFYLTVSNKNGCVATATHSVMVNPEPLVTIVASETTICAGATITFEALNVPYGIFDVTYQWYLNGNPIEGAHGSTHIYTGAQNEDSISFTITHNNGCIAKSNIIEITVNPIPDWAEYRIKILDGALETSPYFAEVCVGSHVRMQAYDEWFPDTPQFPEGTEYIWEIDGLLVQNSTNGNTDFGYTFDTPGTYRVGFYVNAPGSGCQSKIVFIYITVHPAPTVQIVGTPLYCTDDLANVELTANIFPTHRTVLLGTPPYTGDLEYVDLNFKYEWLLDNVLVSGIPQDAVEGVATWTQNLAPSTAPYIYTIRITDPLGGCVTTAEYSVIVQPTPLVPLTVTDNLICSGTQAEIIANVGYSIDLSYQWFSVDADGIATEIPGAISNIYTPVLTVTTPTIFETFRFVMTATNILTGCVAISDTAEVTAKATPMFHPDAPVIQTSLVEGQGPIPSSYRYCPGSQWRLTTLLAPPYSGEGVYPNFVYTWYLGGQEIEGENLRYIDIETPDAGVIHWYSVRVTDTETGCSTLKLNIAKVEGFPIPTAEISGDAFYCTSEMADVVLYPNVQLGGPVGHTENNNATLAWYVDNAYVGGGYTTFPASFTIQLAPRDNPYNVSLVVFNNYTGCYAETAYFLVYVKPTPIIPVEVAETAICEGGVAVLTAHIGGYTDEMIYEWYQVGIEDPIAGVAVHTVTGLTVEDSPYKFTFRAFNQNTDCLAISDTLTVIVNPIPTFTYYPAEDQIICQGQQMEISTLPLETVTTAEFIWKRNGATISGATEYYYSEILDVPGVYNYVATMTLPGSGCVSALNDGILVTVHAAPTVEIGGPSVLCGNATGAQLVAITNPVDAEVNFAWYLEDIPTTVGNDQVLDISDLTPSPFPYNFYVQIIDPITLCMVQSAVYPVYVGQDAVIGITADKTEICAGETVMLTAFVSDDINMIYQWYAGETAIEGANGPTYQANPTETTVYSFTATELISECVVTSSTVKVTVIPVPVFTMTPVEEAICQYAQYTFTAPVLEGVTYAWYINGVKEENAELNEFTFNFNEFGTFVVKVSATSNIAGCTSEIVLAGTITVEEAPGVEIGGPSVLCGNATGAQLVAITNPVDAEVNFAWYLEDIPTTVGNDQVLDISDLTPSPFPYNFYVQIIDPITLCMVQSPVFPVYVGEDAVIGITASQTEACEDETIMLTAFVSNDGNVIYQWYAGETPIEGANGPIYYAKMNETTIFSFTSTEFVSGCVVTSSTVTVTVIKPIAIQSILMDPEHGNICDGGQVQLTAVVEDPTAVAYYLWYQNGFPMDAPADQTIWVSPETVDQDPTDYTYRVEAVPFGKYCPAKELSNPVTVHVVRNPIVEIHGQHHVCDIYIGEHPDPAAPNVNLAVYIDGYTYPTDPADYELGIYQWYLNGARYDVDPYHALTLAIKLDYKPEPYIIKFEYTTPLGCQAFSKEFELFVHPEQVVNITASEDSICNGGHVVLFANLDNYNETDYTYQWYQGAHPIHDNLIPGATMPEYTTPTMTGIETKTSVKYWVVVTQLSTFDDHGDVIRCRVEASYDITVYPKPTIAEITIDKTTICSGGQVTVTAIPSEGNLGEYPVYTWFRNGIVIEGAYLNFITESPLAIDDDITVYIYNAIVTYENSGCSSLYNENLAKQVTVYRNPIVVISGDANICETADVFLKASVDHMSDEVGLLSYIWYESGEERYIEDPIGPSGQFYSEHWPPRYEPYSFTVEVTRGDGCTTISDPFFVWVHALPVVNITANEETVCEGGDVTLTANLNDYNTDNIIYQWYYWTFTEVIIPIGPGMFETIIVPARELIPGATQQDYTTPVLTETIKYEVEVIQTHSLCSATDSKWITVTPIPVIVIAEPMINDTICSGEQATMLVSTLIYEELISDVTYKWFVNGTLIETAITDTYTHQIGEAGTYIYTVQAIVPISGCESEVVLAGTVVVKAAPTVTIEGAEYVCNAATPTQLYAQVSPFEATVTYKWFVTHNGTTTPLGTTQAQAVSNVASPYPYIYEVEITDIESGCVVLSAAHSVYVYQFTTIAITADKTEVCPSETVLLEADVNLDYETILYQWYAGTTAIDGANAPNLYVYPTETTIYSFTATQVESLCSAGSNDVKVTVVQIPVFTMEAILDTICQYEQVTFTAPADDTVEYTWFINGVSIEPTTLNTLTYNFDLYGVFTVEVTATTKIAACTSTAVLAGIITVKYAPAVYIEGSTAVCDTDFPTSLEAIVTPSTATVTYQWSVTIDGETELLGTDPMQVVSNVPNPNPYIYVVEITDIESGCIVKAIAHTVYVGQFTTIGILADKTEVCPGETVTLTANVSESTNMIYQWYAGEEAIEGAIYPNLLVYPMESTIYSFSATQIGSECVTLSNDVLVTVVPIPVFTMEAILDTICQGTQVTFTAPADDSVEYTWFINGMEIEPTTLNVLTYNFDSYGIFTVNVTATTKIAGCTSSEVLAGIIKVKAAPSVVIEGPVVICPTLNPPVLYAVVDPTNATVTYQWYENELPVGGNTSTYTVANIATPYPYVYTVVITDYESGCEDKSLPHTLYVQQQHTIGITASIDKVCPKETVILTADIESYPNVIYQWWADNVAIQGANNPVHYVYPEEPTTYTFTVTEIESNCIVTSNEVLVVVIPIPVIAAVPVEETICIDEQVTFTTTISTPDAVTYVWYINGTKVQGAELSFLTHLFEQAGTFVVEVAATSIEANCSSEVIYAGTIIVKDYPTVTISGVENICNTDADIYLHADITPLDAPVTYQWYMKHNGATTVLGTDAIQIITTAPSPIPYIYTVEITDTESGCVVVSDNHIVTVTQYSNNISIESDAAEVCYGTDVNLSADISSLEGTDWYYQWWHNGSMIENADNTNLTVNEFPGGHIYKFVATQGTTGCSVETAEITIVVKPIPAPPVLTVSNSTICSGNPVTITGDVIGGYEWFKQGISIANGATNVLTEQLTANNILTPYTYEAKVTVNGCTSEISTPVTVVVHPTMSVVIQGANDVCEQALYGEHLALHALVTGLQPGVTYLYDWYYVQDGSQQLLAGQYGPDCVVPNNLPVNDLSAPYYFYVKVTAVDYCTSEPSQAHPVNIWAKPTVTIGVDYENICLSGIIIATAYPTPASTPENPYNYIWTVNGVPQVANANEIAISSDLMVGVNEIAVTIERAYASLSCYGSTTKNVNVLTQPTLALTQNIEGLPLPGMCTGGQLNLFAEVTNFDETLVDPTQFIFEWRRNGNPIGTGLQYNYYSDKLNITGTYNYEVKAFINNSLGCNAVWTAFDPVKVVNQPEVNIHPKDYNLFEVCEGAVIEIHNVLDIVDPTIQMGYQYKWNVGEWTNFTNQIDPLTVEFPVYGSYSFFLDVTFANPTCNAAKSKVLTYSVAFDPQWTLVTVDPNDLLCLGETVQLNAAFTGGISNGNYGTIQWKYQFNEEDYVNIPGPGGVKTHKPAQDGDYYYVATYAPFHELSGCNIDPYVQGPVVVSASPTAWFIAALPGNEIPKICANDKTLEPLVLDIQFTGRAPYTFTVSGSPGNYRETIITNSNPYSLVIAPKPSTTTVYTIESVSDGAGCTASTFVNTQITVIVTDVEILNPGIEACGPTVDVNFKMLSYVSPINPVATVTFPCATPIYVPIMFAGAYHTVTIPIPDCAGAGIHDVVLTIDDCDFEISIVNTFANGRQLIHRRWEGNAEVLAVSNNYMNPESQYYNGGFNFISFQWYKNGVKIEGANKQYYQDPAGVNGTYFVELGIKMADGSILKFYTCEQTFTQTLTMKVYPVPAQVDEPVWVELDLTAEEMNGATLEIYDAKGALVKAMPVVSTLTEVTGFKSQGAYYGKITTGTNEIKTVRFLIVK